MNDLLTLAIATWGIYLSGGVFTIVFYDRVTDGSVDDREEALTILREWPIIVFVAVVGAVALKAARGEA